MGRVKAVLKRLFCLPPLATALISIPSFALVLYVLVTGSEGPLAYAAYGLSAYAMAITTTGIIRVARAVRDGIDEHPLVKKFRAHPVAGRLLHDVAFRAEMSIYPSLCVNLFYAAFKLITGILYSSAWLITLAAYYALLAVMWFLVLTAALVSMLALETAMLSQFGGEDDAMFRQVMLSASGGAACAFVFGMAVYMVIHSTKQIKMTKGDNENGR